MTSQTLPPRVVRGKAPRVSVIIPALNEAKNLPHVFAALPPDVFEVILVDGRSVDGTPDVARRLRPDVKIVRQTRRGKGNALACGFAHARGDVIVMIDADTSTNPAEIPSFVQALVDGADFAKGTRFALGGGSEDITRLRALGNSVLGHIVNALYRTRFTDLCYGYNAFWRDCLPTLGLDAGSHSDDETDRQWGDGFEIETVINLRAAQGALRITEVPSIEQERLYGVSNLNAFRDGVRVVRTIAAEWRRKPISAPIRLVSEQSHVIDLVGAGRMMETVEAAEGWS